MRRCCGSWLRRSRASEWRGGPAAGSRSSGPCSARSCHRPLSPNARKEGVAGTMAACSNSSTSSATLPVIGTGARLARGPSSSRSSDLAPRAGDTTDVVESAAALVASKSWATQWIDTISFDAGGQARRSQQLVVSWKQSVENTERQKQKLHTQPDAWWELVGTTAGY